MNITLVILDHTYGPHQTDQDHLSARQFVEHMAQLRADGLLSEQARVLATHIAHDGNPPHPDLAAFAAGHGYEVAYDRLTL